MNNARRANERYRLLARHIPNAAVALFDRDLNYVMLDGPLIRQTMNPQLLEGKPIADSLNYDPELRDSVRRRCAAVFNGETHYVEFQWQEAIYAWDIAPIYDHDEVYMGMMLVRDVTAEHRTQEEMERLLLQAQEALRIRDDFLSIAAHELKTPLTSIIGYAQLLEHRSMRSLSADDQRVLRVVLNQSDKLNAMINALLDVSRIQQGRLEIRRHTCDLALLVQQVVDQMQMTTEQHIIKVELPPSLICSLDGNRIEQVIRNLLSNAIKYEPDGGEVFVLLTHNDKEAMLTVIDHGIGIPPEAIPHLFEQYYRAENVGPKVNTAISGLGVGLYVSSEIVKQHGGTITAISDGKHRGATFVVRLPLWNSN